MHHSHYLQPRLCTLSHFIYNISFPSLLGLYLTASKSYYYLHCVRSGRRRWNSVKKRADIKERSFPAWLHFFPFNIFFSSFFFFCQRLCQGKRDDKGRITSYTRRHWKNIFSWAVSSFFLRPSYIFLRLY